MKNVENNDANELFARLIYWGAGLLCGIGLTLIVHADRLAQ